TRAAMAEIAIGSVGDTTAANANATVRGMAGIIQCTKKPTPTTVRATRPSASSRTAVRSFSNSSFGMRQPSRNSRGGMKRKQSPLDVSCSARKPVRRAESTAPTSSEAGRPLDEISHVGCGMYGQRMMGKARPRRNITGHFASHFELLIRCRGEQRNQQILQRDDPDAQRDKLGVAHFRSWNLFFVSRCGHDGTSGPSFVLPSRQRLLTLE